MGFFDRARNFLDRFTGRKPQASEPTIDQGIETAWTQPARKPSFFDNLKERARNFFRPQEAKKPAPPAQPEAAPPEEFKPSRTPSHFKPESSDVDARKYEIFKFRRATSEDEKTFYRLTQSIWDAPGVPADKRDEAIQSYFIEKYGISDMNEIFDIVLSKNADKVEAYRNSPNDFKYDVIKNISIHETAL